MKSKKTVSTFFLIALVGAFVLSTPLASAAETALMFHGQLVNAGCEAKVMGATAPLHGLKSLPVAAHLKMSFVSRDDACEGAVNPVAIAYTERASAAFGQRAGTVTLTYQ